MLNGLSHPGAPRLHKNNFSSKEVVQDMKCLDLTELIIIAKKIENAGSIKITVTFLVAPPGFNY